MVLTTVVSQDPIYVYFDCDEHSYLRFQERVHRGSGVSSANPVRVALANETGFPHIGRVDFLDNQVIHPREQFAPASCFPILSIFSLQVSTRAFSLKARRREGAFG